MSSPPDFRAEVRRRGSSTGTDLPDAMVEELAQHLEDLYEAALAAGATPSAATQQARRALEGSSSHTTRPTRGADRAASKPGRHDRTPRRPSSVPPPPGLCADRGDRPRPLGRGRDHGLLDRGHGGPSAASLSRAGSPRHHLGHERREGARPRSDLAGDVHGSAGIAGVQRCGRVVASGREPDRSRARSASRADDRRRAATSSTYSASARSSARAFPAAVRCSFRRS